MRSDQLGDLAKRVSPRLRALHAIYGTTCIYCGLAYSVTIDHYVPKARGGSNRLHNLRPSCQECNVEKRDMMPDEWKRHLKKMPPPYTKGSKS